MARPLTQTRWIAAFKVALTLSAALTADRAAADPCRQALALGLDVSGSVNSAEYRLQLDGLANALDSDAVRKVILSAPSAPIQISVYEWSGPDHQRLLNDWIAVDSPAKLAQLTQNLRSTQRVRADPSTALGAAMAFGVGLLRARPNCAKHSLDISGDGGSNTGPRPRDVRRAFATQRLTINGLVISSAENGDDLMAYYEEEVAFGPGHFVEQANGFAQYEDAMIRKLLREMQGLALSALSPSSHDTPAATAAVQ